jgi:RNA polymerase sigma factor (sigma-70 family)
MMTGSLSGVEARDRSGASSPAGVPAQGGTRTVDAAAADFSAWCAGEEAGLERLVRRLTPMLWHIARAYGLEQGGAEDVVQLAWLALVRHRETIADPQAVVRWLSVTVRREAWRQVKAVRATARLDEEDVVDLRADEGQQPEPVLERAERDGALWRAVGQLPDRCQRLLRVVAFEEHADYATLSVQLSMPVGSIGPTRGRCLAKLRTLLGAASDWRTT